ncbi:hypothetical protein CUJ83_10740 [Methanocella sp. CWC-04]|uniref:histidine kinase n=1 Tax=Methanooceanicella nereidis TaxID=2052831 RepID=A0AAP2RF78_9EURY|nr:sensor histidine kinase [Methanocella sp. CWC-04]MCD1295475.1 hypothetical protein [Methanocella sp. CWC-04]
MRYISIKLQAMILLLILLTLPIISVGTISSIYYRDQIRQDIWDTNLAQAKAISILTSNYVGSATVYLESQSVRPSVIRALDDGDIAYLNEVLEFIRQTSPFYAAYIIDDNGTIVASYPFSDLVGKNYSEKPHVLNPLKTGSSYVTDASISPIVNKPTIYIGVPIKKDDKTIGVIVGTIDLTEYSAFVLESQTRNREYTYLVNRTGHIFVHYNKGYMDTMKNYSYVPGVRNVLRGEEGVIEQYNPVENDIRLAAYSPVSKYGWGVVVALPVDIAYQPITETTNAFIIFILFLILLSSVIAYLIGKYFVDPIIKMARATIKMPRGDYRKYLPIERNDEIGELARSMDAMAQEIRTDQEKIVNAKNHAEDERNRAELYLDIMGHDINNLNQTTLNSLELLREDETLTDEQRKKLMDNAIASIQGSAGIIDNVRKIQRITSEKLELEIVDINKMILSCIDEAPHPPGKKVAIHYTPHEGLYVRGISLLKEVFCNIIDNSVKYSGDEVDINIVTGEKYINSKLFYTVTISDTGYGIPDDVKPKLFRRFQRGTTKAHGKGLGLYIVRTLVERFGGSVEIRDRVPGDHKKGVSFIISLPAADEEYG